MPFLLVGSIAIVVIIGLILRFGWKGRLGKFFGQRRGSGARRLEKAELDASAARARNDSVNYHELPTSHSVMELSAATPPAELPATPFTRQSSQIDRGLSENRGREKEM